MPKDPAAVKLGRKGGKVKSAAKTEATRRNLEKARRVKAMMVCGRCGKHHTRKQLNICDDGIASGDSRNYPIKR